MMRVVVGLALLAAQLAVLAPTTGRANSTRAGSVRVRPNILVIITDDQRSDTLEAMPETARFFGGGGLTFSNAYATTPVCCPSRASVMTGRYAHNHGVKTNGDRVNLDQGTTIQRYLHDAGYATGGVGKFLNRWPIDRSPGHFDKWAFIDDSNYSNVYYDFTANVDGEITTYGDRLYSTDFVRTEAMRMLREFDRSRDADPWFLYVAPFSPHRPFTPEDQFADSLVSEWDGDPAVLEQDRTDKPPWVQDRSVDLEQGQEMRVSQLRMLMSVDELVKGIAIAMEVLGEKRDTLAVFLSDNGWLWGEHGLAGKGQPYTRSVHIPMFLRWPGHVAPGSTTDRLVANIDVAPTLLRAAGISRDGLRASLDGRDLLTSKRSRLLLEHFAQGRHGIPEWASLLTHEMQYVEYYPDGETFLEYYDLIADPYQLENSAADHPVETDAMSRELVELKECSGRSCP